jgi:hypothetical protein
MQAHTVSVSFDPVDIPRLHQEHAAVHGNRDAFLIMLLPLYGRQCLQQLRGIAAVRRPGSAAQTKTRMDYRDNTSLRKSIYLFIPNLNSTK